MPAVFLETNKELTNPTELAQALSKLVANELQKPEKYVTVVIRKAVTITRGGIVTDFVFVEVRSIGGLNKTVNNSLAKGISKLLKEHSFEETNIDLNFVDVAPQNWGKYKGVFEEK